MKPHAVGTILLIAGSVLAAGGGVVAGVLGWGIPGLVVLAIAIALFLRAALLLDREAIEKSAAEDAKRHRRLVVSRLIALFLLPIGLYFSVVNFTEGGSSLTVLFGMIGSSGGTIAMFVHVLTRISVVGRAEEKAGGRP